MAQLVTTAVLRASDQLTGPLLAAANRVRSLQGKFTGTSDGARKLGSSLGGVAAGAGGAAFGLSAMVLDAQEASRALQGLGVTTVFDKIADGADKSTAVTSALGVIQDATERTVALARQLQVAPENIAKTYEAVAKAGMEAKLLDEATRSINLVKLTDPDANIASIAAYTNALVGLGKAYNLLNGKSAEEYIRDGLGSAAAIAAKTPLSTGEFIEGRQKFQAIASAAGVSNTEQDVMLGVLAARNVKGDVGGTTVRSNFARAMSPTAMQQGAWNASGLSRLSYMDAAAAEPTRIAQGLGKRSFGRIGGKDLKNIEREITEAQKAGVFADEKFQSAMIRQVGKLLGADMTNEDTAQKVAELWAESALAGGIKFDMPRLLADLAKHRDGDALVGQLFERKRHSENVALLSGYRPDADGKVLADDLRKGSQGGAAALAAQLDLHLKSTASVADRLLAQMRLFNFQVANSEPMLNFLQQLNTGLEMLNDTAKSNPALVKAGTTLALLGMLAVPVSLAASALAKLGVGVVAAGAALGRLAALPFARVSGMLAALGVANFAKGRIAGSPWARFFAPLVSGLGTVARFAGPVGMIVGTLAMLSDPTKLAEGFNKLTQGEGFKALVAQAQGLWESIKGLASAADDLVGRFLEMFGIKAEGSALMTGIDLLFGAISRVVETLRAAIDLLSGNAKGAASGAFGGGNAPSPPSVDDTGGAAVPSLGEIDTSGAQLNLAPTGPAHVEMSSGSAGTIGEALANAFRSALGSVSINVNGGAQPGAVARAAAPTTSNGSVSGGR